MFKLDILRQKFDASLLNSTTRFLGFPCTQRFNHAHLANYLQWLTNNIGDPYQSGSFMVNSKEIERAVIKHYADLYHLSTHEDQVDLPKNYWGYVLTMGSTEGNMYGIYSGREYLIGTAIADVANSDLNDKKTYHVQMTPKNSSFPRDKLDPVVFYSSHSHYSIAKASRVLRVKDFGEVAMEQGWVRPAGVKIPGNDSPSPKEWPHELPTNYDGSINLELLTKIVEPFAKSGHPLIFVFNLGTTVTNAMDPIKQAINEVVSLQKRYGNDKRIFSVKVKDKTLEQIRDNNWFHIDAALGGGYMPYYEKLHPSKDYPYMFDFRLPEVCSIVTSGHKWPGAPWPTGVFIMRKSK